tara:strand:- start:2596 stop:2748 length:153 start_codon:yes stop_codon:yes gene_type:complete
VSVEFEMLDNRLRNDVFFSLLTFSNFQKSTRRLGGRGGNMGVGLGMRFDF